MTEETKQSPVLYILMRTDMESMNSGKAIAQGSHAANAFINDQPIKVDPLVDAWTKETPQGFGTVLVLAVDESQMRTAVAIAREIGLSAEVIHDPTYPLRDGSICHFLPIDTCAYIFMDKNDPIGQSIVKNFPLHP